MFSRAVKLVTIRGFDIKFDPSWIIIAVLITWTLSVQYFPTALPGHSPAVYLAMAVAAMIGLFASLLLHEMAHSIVAQRLGVAIKSITLFLFGGVAELEGEPQTAEDELKIAMAGPAASFAIALAMRMVGDLAIALPLDDTVVKVVLYLSTVNLLLGLFNLLPAFPLDGGRVLRALLWKRSGDILQATETAAKSGGVLAYVLIGIGLLAIFNGYVVSGLWQIFLGSFLLVAARSSYEQQLQKTVLSGRTVADAMTPNPVTVAPDMTLAHVVNQIMLRDRVSFLPVVENGNLLGRIDSDVLGKIDRDNWNSTRVDDVFIRLNGDRLLEPDTSILAVLEEIAHSGQRKFLVTDAGHLVGVITLADLTRYIALMQNLAPKPKPRQTLAH